MHAPSEPTPGQCLLATPWMIDPSFHKTVVVIAEHDDTGTLGLILNRTTEHPIDDTFPFFEIAAPPNVVFTGGPVATDHGLGLARGVGPFNISFSAGNDRYGLVTDSTNEIAAVRFYVGHAGWEPGQLAEELEAGAWWVVATEPEDIFIADPDKLWSRMVRRQATHIAMYASFPDDPHAN